MGRIRTAAIGGLVEDNPLASGAVLLTSAGLSALPLFAAGDFALAVFDPNGRTGEPFAKRISAHGSNATTATIDAAAIYGTARSIPQGTPWRLTDILDQDGNGAGLIQRKRYNPASLTTVSVSAGVINDLDASLVLPDFVVPPSGIVCVELSAISYSGDLNQFHQWAIRSAANVVQGDGWVACAVSTHQSRAFAKIYVDALTPGAVISGWKWSQTRTAGTGTSNTQFGGSAGAAVMEVKAVNV